MRYSWVAFLGEYRKFRNSIIFKGSTVPSPQPGASPMGSVANIICDQLFEEGTITAEVEFRNIDPTSACQIIINYESFGNILCAGISNNSGFMYEIRIFENMQWTSLAIVGDRRNLKKDRKYLLKASIKGTFIVLNIDGVDVLTHNLNRPIRESKVGIWSQSQSNITIRNFNIIKDKPKIFIVMPFDPPYDKLYEDIIKKACEEYKTNPVKADESYVPGLIIGDILKHIYESKAIIAEISEKNLNVYYEIGLAHALNKPSILIAKRKPRFKLPFDISSFKVIFYEDTLSGKKKLSDGIKEYLKSILNTQSAFNP